MIIEPDIVRCQPLFRVTAGIAVAFAVITLGCGGKVAFDNYVGPTAWKTSGLSYYNGLPSGDALPNPNNADQGSVYGWTWPGYGNPTPLPTTAPTFAPNWVTPPPTSTLVVGSIVSSGNPGGYPIGGWWGGLAVICACIPSLVSLDKTWVIVATTLLLLAICVAISAAVTDGLVALSCYNIAGNFSGCDTGKLGVGLNTYKGFKIDSLTERLLATTSAFNAISAATCIVLVAFNIVALDRTRYNRYAPPSEFGVSSTGATKY